LRHHPSATRRDDRDHTIERLRRRGRAADDWIVRNFGPRLRRKIVSENRKSGLFRAAALLAIGASPLLAGAASAVATPSLEPAEGKVPAVDADPVKEAEKLVSGNSVKLPPVPAAPGVPAAPAPEAAPVAPQPRDLPASDAVPGGVGLSHLDTLNTVAGMVAPDTSAVTDMPVGVPSTETVKETLNLY
jgi:hypothetical protein